MPGNGEDGGKISASLSNKYEGRFADGTDAQLQQAKKNLEFNINRLTETVASQEELNKISKGIVDEQLAINRNSLKEVKLQYDELQNEFKKRGINDTSFSLSEKTKKDIGSISMNRNLISHLFLLATKTIV